MICTPILQDFVDTAGVTEDVKNLVRTVVTVAMTAAGVDDNSHPLPQIKLRKAGVVPPFLMTTFMSSDDPLTILSSCLVKIREFLVANINPTEHDDWWKSCFPMMQRLWYLMGDPVSQIKAFALVTPLLTEATDDWFVKKFKAEGDLLFGIPNFGGLAPLVFPPSAPIDPIFVQILQQNSTLLTQNADSFTRMSENQEGGGGGGDGNGTTKFKKRFHTKQQTFILLASSGSDSSLSESEPNAEFKQLVESPKTQALSLVQYGIEQRGGTQTVDNAFAMMLYNANFMDGDKSGLTKGLSIFFMAPAPYLNGQETMNAHEVELRSTTNNLSNAQITKLTASQVQIPKDENGFRVTLENYLAVIDFVFSKKSLFYKAIEVLQGQIKDHIAEFSTMVESDPRFIAGFMSSIDYRVQKFLASCSKSQDSSQTKYHFLDFDREVDDFVFQRKAYVRLPFAVESLLQSQSTKRAADKLAGGRDQSSSTSGETPAQKKQKKLGKSPGTVKNNSPIDKSWIKVGENFSAFHNDMKSAPKLRGEVICVKYHIQGFCPYGDKCARKNTHTSDFDDGTKKAFGSWIKKVREGVDQQS